MQAQSSIDRAIDGIHLGRRLAAGRVLMGLTQQAVADRLRCNRMTVSRMEATGIGQVVAAYAELVGVSLETGNG